MIGTIVDIWPIVDFVFRSFKYLELVMVEFDRFYGHTSQVMTPIEAFNSAVDELGDVWNGDDPGETPSDLR
jgi:hypothetical protein